MRACMYDRVWCKGSCLGDQLVVSVAGDNIGVGVLTQEAVCMVLSVPGNGLGTGRTCWSCE